LGLHGGAISSEAKRAATNIDAWRCRTSNEATWRHHRARHATRGKSIVAPAAMTRSVGPVFQSGVRQPISVPRAGVRRRDQGLPRRSQLSRRHDRLPKNGVRKPMAARLPLAGAVTRTAHRNLGLAAPARNRRDNAAAHGDSSLGYHIVNVGIFYIDILLASLYFSMSLIIPKKIYWPGSCFNWFQGEFTTRCIWAKWFK
jgi:hypothetical protein